MAGSRDSSSVFRNLSLFLFYLASALPYNRMAASLSLVCVFPTSHPKEGPFREGRWVAWPRHLLTAGAHYCDKRHSAVAGPCCWIEMRQEHSVSATATSKKCGISGFYCLRRLGGHSKESHEGDTCLREGRPPKPRVGSHHLSSPAFLVFRD